jgi:hypothetical protein
MTNKLRMPKIQIRNAPAFVICVSGLIWHLSSIICHSAVPFTDYRLLLVALVSTLLAMLQLSKTRQKSPRATGRNIIEITDMQTRCPNGITKSVPYQEQNKSFKRKVLTQ